MHSDRRYMKVQRQGQADQWGMTDYNHDSGILSRALYSKAYTIYSFGT